MESGQMIEDESTCRMEILGGFSQPQSSMAVTKSLYTKESIDAPITHY